jgi:hypothetical protein
VIGVCIRDVNGPRNPAHVAANDLGSRQDWRHGVR